MKLINFLAKSIEDDRLTIFEDTSCRKLLQCVGIVSLAAALFCAKGTAFAQGGGGIDVVEIPDYDPAAPSGSENDADLTSIMDDCRDSNPTESWAWCVIESGKIKGHGHGSTWKEALDMCKNDMKDQYIALANRCCGGTETDELDVPYTARCAADYDGPLNHRMFRGGVPT